MCVPLCLKSVGDNLSRRDFLKFTGMAVTAAALSSCSQAVSLPPDGAPRYTFSQMLDLTHTITPEFPTYSDLQFTIESIARLETEGYNVNKWLLAEHTGTHMDAPSHFSDKDSADLIPVDNLFGPLVVVNISSRAENNPDTQLTLNDLKEWENKNGPIPDGSIVAMYSGWDAYVQTNKFKNDFHFPGFHIEAIEFLLEERLIKGICVDTLSLDYGQSTDFAVHYRWLPANRWGIECVANLGQLPAKGATMIVGGPKINGASGGPSRVVALI